MKFDELYEQMILELNVAGGVAGVFGPAAGDGDPSTGWGDSSDARLPTFLGATTKKKKRKKRKKRAKKRVKRMGEDGTIAYTKGPVQSRPPIERVFGFQENTEPGAQGEMLPNDPLKSAKPKQLTQRELDMIVNQSVGLLSSVPAKDFNRVVNRLMQQLNKAKQLVRVNKK